MTIRFDDRVAIVTGSGAGLGQHLLPRHAAGEPWRKSGGERSGWRAVDGRGGQHAVADKVVAEIKAPPAKPSGGELRTPVADMKGAQKHRLTLR